MHTTLHQTKTKIWSSPSGGIAPEQARNQGWGQLAPRNFQNIA